jgi:thiamine biosynthesis lipoprotein
MRANLRWIIGLGLGLLVVKLHPIPAHAQGVLHEFREAHLGMEMRIVVAHASSDTAAALVRRAFDAVEAYEAILSDWRAQSEVRRLESAEPGSWVPISTPLRDVLTLALRIARESGGAFDPTVGPLTKLWREARRTGTAIDASRRDSTLQRVGYRLVELDSAGSRARLARRGMRLDLGGVAKGWILDRALEVLLEPSTASAALVEAGGDVVVRGAPPGTAGWRIRVPRAHGDTLLVLTSGAVSSSGSSVQRIIGADGTIESHVLSPSTGRGIAGDETVTVVGPNGAIADALATALSLVAVDRRARLAARFGVTVVAPIPH